MQLMCEFMFAVMYLLHNVRCCLFNATCMSISMSANFLFTRIRQSEKENRERVKTMHCKNAIVNKCQEGTNQFNDTLMVQISILRFVYTPVVSLDVDISSTAI